MIKRRWDPLRNTLGVITGLSWGVRGGRTCGIGLSPWTALRSSRGGKGVISGLASSVVFGALIIGWCFGDEGVVFLTLLGVSDMTRGFG